MACAMRGAAIAIFSATQGSTQPVKWVGSFQAMSIAKAVATEVPMLACSHTMRSCSSASCSAKSPSPWMTSSDAGGAMAGRRVSGISTLPAAR